MLNSNLSDSSQLAAHKQGNTAFVAPILVTNITVAVALSFNWSIDYAIACALTAVAFTVNISFVLLFPKLDQIRNDYSDTIRWCFNILCIDVPVAIYLKSSFVIVAAFWMIIVIGSFIDVYERRLRSCITLLAFVAACVSLEIAFPSEAVTSMLVFVSSTISVLAFIFAIESNWMKETALRNSVQKREGELLSQAQDLYKSSLTGENTKLIAHEVDNMITAINFATDNPKDINVGNIKLSLGYVKNACHLLMKESTTKTQVLRVEDMLNDLNLLVRKQVEAQGVEWKVEVDPGVESEKFQERQGSSYFIVQNFVRNSLRAIKEVSDRRGRILVRISREDAKLKVAIFDNGKGIDSSTKEKLLSGQSRAIDQKQHGLGTQFVIQECAKNGFQFFIEDCMEPEFITLVGLRIPTIKRG